MVVPDLVVLEVCYLLAKGARASVEALFLRSLLDRTLTIEPESVKQFETLSYDTFCAASSWATGSLIQAAVGSFGGSGFR